MQVWKRVALCMIFGVQAGSRLNAEEQNQTNVVLKNGSTLAIRAMNGFEYYLMAALYKNHLPLKLVLDPKMATYIVEGRENSSRASNAKVFWLGTDVEHLDVSLDVIETSDDKQLMHYERSRSMAGHGLQAMADDFARKLRDKTETASLSRASVPKNPKVYVAVGGEFRTALVRAFQKKQVPLRIVDSREDADYLLEGDSQSTKADTRRKVLMLDWQSREQAAIALSSLKDGQVVFAYAYYYDSSNHGLRSSAESCAKHLGEILQMGNAARVAN